MFVSYQKASERAIIGKAAQEAQAYQQTLQKGADSYASLSRSTAAFFAASSDVTAEEFAAYMKSMDAFATHPGLATTGYVPRVPSSSAAEFEAYARKTYPSFQIHGGREKGEDAYPFFFNFPQNERARQLRGFDNSAIPERWEAMQKARDLGTSIATAKHPALQDPLKKRFVILIFAPVYDLHRPVATVEQRRAALKGFVFATFYVDDTIDQLMGPRFKSLFDLEIYDGATTSGHMVYDGDNQPHALIPNDLYPVIHSENVDFASRNWRVYFYPKAHYLKRYDTAADVLILFCGLLLSIMLAFLTGKWQRRVRTHRLQIQRGQSFQAVFENHPFAVYYMDLERRIINANTKAIEELQFRREKIIGSSVEQFIAPEKATLAREKWADVLKGHAVNYDSILINGRGERLDVNVVLIPITTGETISSVLGIAQNVTERKQLEQRLHQMAHYDSLTGLPNRAFFYDQLEQALGRRRRYNSLLGLMYFDIDHFKDINDTYGHGVGDEAIQTFARRVKTVLREIDIMGRLGGDEFALIIEDLSSMQAAELVATRIIEVIQPAFQIGGMSLSVGTSIGIAFHEPGMSADQLIRVADHAMYKAKKSGGNRFEIQASPSGQ